MLIVFFEFNDDHIQEVVYDVDDECKLSEDINLSTFVTYKNNEYIVIGTNVFYPQTDTKMLTCFLVSENEFKIEQIHVDDVDVSKYGCNKFYLNLNKLNEKRQNYVNNEVLNFINILPIGSVVLIKPNLEDFEALIIARNVNVDGYVYDYLVCSAKTGYISDDLCFGVDKKHIFKLIMCGYFNNDELEYSRQIVVENGKVEGTKNE